MLSEHWKQWVFWTQHWLATLAYYVIIRICLYIHLIHSQMLTFCFAFDVCSGAKQTSRGDVWTYAWRLYRAVLETTDKRRRQAQQRLLCREAWAWLWQMDKVCVAVKYIHVCFFVFLFCTRSACQQPILVIIIIILRIIIIMTSIGCWQALTANFDITFCTVPLQHFLR